MSHATWYAGSLAPASNWRIESTPRPPRPHPSHKGSRSPSPRRKKEEARGVLAINHKNHAPAQSRQLSPPGDCYDKCHSYHYLEDSTPKSTPITPQTSNQRKKYLPGCQRGKKLGVNEKKSMSKSPSAPNLQATSMLALQGSLAGFTAMAVGNYKPRDRDNARGDPAAQKRPQTASPQPREQNIAGKSCNPRTPSPLAGPYQQPRCTCNYSHLSPTPRLKVRTATPPVEARSPNNDGPAWLERRDFRAPKKDSPTTAPVVVENAVVETHSRSMLFKETRV